MDRVWMATNDIGVWLVSSGLRIALVVLAAVVSWRFILSRLRRWVAGLSYASEEQRQRVETLASVGEVVAGVAIVVSAALTILSELGISVTPILTSAGVVGLAVGLGSQSLVRDFVAGFFVLSENQFAIGDHIKVAGVSGEVEKITLRTTWLRDEHGEVHIVPNSSISVMTNYTKSWSRIVLPFKFPLDEDGLKVCALLDEIADQIASDEMMKESLLENPVVEGPEELAAGTVTYEIVARVQPDHLRTLQRRARVLAMGVLRQSDVRFL